MKALIIAAGKGTRFNHLTEKTHKSLIPLLGLSLIERIILTVKLLGIDEFIIVIGYKGEKIKEKLGNGEKLGVKISYVENLEYEKGNGISVLKAKDMIGNEKFLLLMSDHIFEADILRGLLEQKIKSDECMLAVDYFFRKKEVDLEDANKVKIQNGKIINIGKTLKDFEAVDTGIFLCNPVLFEVLAESIAKNETALSSGIKILAKKGKMRFYDIKEALWIDIDSMKMLKKSEKMLPRMASKHGTIHGIVTRYLNQYLHEPLVRFFAKTPVTPNMITILAFIASLFAMFFFIFRHPIWAGIFIQLSSVLDGADGKLARVKHKMSPFGGILDSFFDLFADFVIFFGMAWFLFQSISSWLPWFLAFLALCGTIAVSIPAAISIPFGIYSVSLSKLYRCVPSRQFQKWDKLIVEISPACKDARFLYLALGSILNLIFPTLIFIASTTILLAIYRIIRAWFFLHKLSEKQIRDYLKKLGGWS